MTLDPSDPRDTVISAGRQRLLTHGIDGLRSQLNASVLSKEVPVSRDTAYRVFRDDESGEPVTDAIVAAVAAAAHDTAWSGTEATLRQALETYTAHVNSGSDPATTLIAFIRVSFEEQFRSPGQPVAWILQAAALTGSKAWKGDPPPDDSVALARKILDERRAFYETWEEQMASFFVLAMSEARRRPRIDPRAIMALLHSLMDGAVLRHLIDPDSIPLDLAAEAMYCLGLAFTEEGPTDDPRKPEDERNQAVFDRLLQAAAALWRSRPEVGVDEAAAHAGVAPEAANLLFPDVGDLADSLIRAHVVAGGFVDLGPFPTPLKARQHLPGLVSELQRIRNLAAEIPHAMAATQRHHPTRSKSFADEFVSAGTRLVDALEVTPRSEQLLRDLLDFASRGNPGWASVVALLRTIGYDVDQPDQPGPSD
jgi:AcrR family transcriptional regulator